MDRRKFVMAATAFTSRPDLGRCGLTDRRPPKWVQPGHEGWPSPEQWATLGQRLSGRLLAGVSVAELIDRAGGPAQFAATLKNPWAIADEPSLAQLSGWTGAWTAAPGAMVVEAATAADVAHAIRFAGRFHVRLVVRGGGHSYKVCSSAPGSLMIWTHRLDGIHLHDDFPGGREHRPRIPAVSIGAGAVWMQAYNAVTTKGGRYVQGGGCASVGVGGLIQGGGFGSFSKQFGLAAASLLEAELVTADGNIRRISQQTAPDLFWAIKGGGQIGVLTRVTLRTHDIPARLGDVGLTLKARDDDSFRGLIGKFIKFYAAHLFNPQWGESAAFTPGRRLKIDMVCCDFEAPAIGELWRPFVDSAIGDGSVTVERALQFESLPGDRWWDPDYLERFSPGSVFRDPRPGAPNWRAWWQGDSDQAASFIHGYHSTWLDQRLIDPGRREELAGRLFRASRHWSVSLHFNKALAGAPVDARAEALRTACNPVLTESFALAIISGESAPRIIAKVLRDSDEDTAHADAAAMKRANQELRRGLPWIGSYVSESDYFEPDHAHAFWGVNAPRLLAVKRAVDPLGMFTLHDSVDAEEPKSPAFSGPA